MFDISIPIRDGMPVVPGDPKVSIRRVRSLDRGDAYNLSSVSLGSHTGTHVDPPNHFVAGGETIDQIDLNRLNGPCWVVSVAPGSALITPQDIDRAPAGAERVLFHTSNSDRWAQAPDEYFSNYVALSLEAADRLLQLGIRLVGIDALSIESDPTGTYPVHQRLLGGGALLLEGLQLHGVPSAGFELRCLPLRIAGGDGGPCRAVLLGR
ncbi:MAG: cyclase family protein [Thermoplasmata archaeon]|nr:cyclase family protein [Thermoplasmata archaeon]